MVHLNNINFGMFDIPVSQDRLFYFSIFHNNKNSLNILNKVLGSHRVHFDLIKGFQKCMIRVF